MSCDVIFFRYLRLKRDNYIDPRIYCLVVILVEVFINKYGNFKLKSVFQELKYTACYLFSILHRLKRYLLICIYFYHLPAIERSNSVFRWEILNEILVLLTPSKNKKTETKSKHQILFPFLFLFLSLSGNYWVRTSDPLLVRQMLWTSWAKPPFGTANIEFFYLFQKIIWKNML